MTIPNLQLITTKQFTSPVLGTGVRLCSTPTAPPTVAVCVINWADYGVSAVNSRLGVVINIQQTSQQIVAPLDAIRSVKIDNSYSAVPIYLQFPDTGDVVTCPPYAIVQTPVLTNALIATVYGDNFFTGRSPKTTVEFFNYALAPLFIEGSLIDSVKLRYGGGTQNSAATSVVNLPAFSPSFLAPTRTRVLICTVAAACTGGGTTNFSISALSASGTPMTIVENDGTLAQNGGVNARVYMATAYCLYPTSSNVTLQITTTVADDRNYRAHFWSMDNYTVLAPYSTSSEIKAGALGLLSVNVSVIPGAVGVFSAMDGGTVDGETQWSGADLVDLYSLSPLELSSADKSYNVNTYANVNNSGNVLQGCVWI